MILVFKYNHIIIVRRMSKLVKMLSVILVIIKAAMLNVMRNAKICALLRDVLIVLMISLYYSIPFAKRNAMGDIKHTSRLFLMLLFVLR